MSLFQNSLIQRLLFMSLRLVCLFHLPAMSVYILDMAVHNFCRKRKCISKSFSRYFIHQPKQAVGNPDKRVAAEGQSWGASSPALPEGDTSPSTLAVASWSWEGSTCPPGPAGQAWAVLLTVPLLGGANSHQDQERTLGFRVAAARQKAPCFSSPCSCPSGSHSVSVSWNNTEINKVGYYFYHCYIFWFTSTVKVKWAFKRFYSQWRVSTMNRLRSANVPSAYRLKRKKKSGNKEGQTPLTTSDQWWFFTVGPWWRVLFHMNRSLLWGTQLWFASLPVQRDPASGNTDWCQDFHTFFWFLFQITPTIQNGSNQC